jgi:hypothetical protein
METVDGLWRSRLVRQGEELEMGTNGLIVLQTPPAVASWMARKRRVVPSLLSVRAVLNPRSLIAVGMVASATSRLHGPP